MNIILLTPSRRFIANRAGLGYQIPLGLVLIGGPLLDVGHQVQLIDNDVLGLNDEQLINRLKGHAPECIMIGHSGSTAAHPVAMQTAQSLRQAFPQTYIIYGGVYPSYTAQKILDENPCLDVIVQGEGEETVLELVAALECSRGALRLVKGITWRSVNNIVSNPRRAMINDLDRFRPGWELVDWSQYQMFGFGISAGMQFSRGCTLSCTYCGQWSFWRKWRHRSVKNFVEQLEVLAHDFGVNIVWFADENFAVDQLLVRQIFEAVIERNLGLSFNLNMTAADVVRDAELLPLYKQAGVDNIILGIEFLDDVNVEQVRKNNPYTLSLEAIRLLRKHGIVSLVNIIYGLETENISSLGRTYQNLIKLDPDILNAVYITPHHWTIDGRKINSEQIIQPLQSYWTYRNQVLVTPKLRPWLLFTMVKITEIFFHLRPKALWRLCFGADHRYRKIMRAYQKVGIKVILAEIYEFLFMTKFKSL